MVRFLAYHITVTALRQFAFLPLKNKQIKKQIALKPMLAEVDFHHTQIEAKNLFFLKLFLGRVLFFVLNYQHFIILCIKKALKVLQNKKTVVSLHHN